jgi:hypothetical protein
MSPGSPAPLGEPPHLGAGPTPLLTTDEGPHRPHDKDRLQPARARRTPGQGTPVCERGGGTPYAPVFSERGLRDQRPSCGGTCHDDEIRRFGFPPNHIEPGGPDACPDGRDWNAAVRRGAPSFPLTARIEREHDGADVHRSQARKEVFWIHQRSRRNAEPH